MLPTRKRLSFVALALLLAGPAVAQPPGCPTQADVVHLTDFESGSGGWTQFGTNFTWVLSSARSWSGAVSAFVPGVDTPSQESLYSPSIVLPPGAMLLRFHQWQEIESAPNNPPHACYDGAVIEISTQGGGDTYQRIDSEIVTPPYDGPIHTDTGSPLAGDNAWCGDSRDWHETQVDLSAFADHPIHLRFRFASDSSVDREGWYIDDVRIEACEGVFFDNFELGDTSLWTASVP